MKLQQSILTPQLRVLLRFFQIVALLGLGYSVATLAVAPAYNADWMTMLYTTWFALNLVSAEAILYRIKAGVVTLVISTAIIAIAEVLAGVASIGGASLGLLVAFIVIVYVRPLWEEFD